MKISHFFKSSILLVFCALIFSCTKQNDYNYIDVNSINISTADTNFVVQQQDTLTIRLQIQESRPGSGPYTYLWTAYRNVGETAKSETVTLSTDEVFNEVITLPPNTYFIQCTIHDASTGISTAVRYNLTVNSSFYQGFVVLSNTNGNGELSFIRSDDRVYHHLFTAVNGQTMVGTPLGIFSGIHYLLADINIFTNSNFYRLDANSMRLTASTNDLFTQSSFTRPYYSVNYYGTDQYVINNGGLHANVAPQIAVPGKYSERIAGDYVAFPYFMRGYSIDGAIYDNKNLRFLQIRYMDRTLMPFSNADNQTFDMNNIGKTMIACDEVSNEGRFYSIMRDQNNAYFFYEIDLNRSAQTGITQQILNSPQISQLTAFASSLLLRQCYYSVDNQIYLYDVVANNARVIYSFPAGTRIKTMMMYRNIVDTVDPLIGNRLIVGTSNGSVGELYYFNLTTSGAFENNTYIKKFEGFGDIVSVDFRPINY